MPSARELATAAESHDGLSPGASERFAGYALMSLPFRSEYVLGLRRFPVTSVGPGYTSVWLRAPDGAWTIYTTIAASLSCPRYFGSALDATSVHEIAVDWTGASAFTVRIVDDVDLHWTVALAETGMTRMMSGMASALPDGFWRNGMFLSALGGVAGPSLRAGRIGMTGRTPNRQRFRARVRRMWIVEDSSASLRGQDLGEVAPLDEQTRLGDFWMPQRGIFMLGGAEFDPEDAGEHPPTTKAAA
ncbi:hypothetical protein OED01_12265 [Microbacterium sp. M28]|uniref:hypothetical protein n=1 Tax=Microbacterium sp. M28 TaxID=2962064 RepID=UPI0021F3E4F5|nr:hypothetical protein [Microbacterium sp. M28]UYO96371.1 hypothetical protein OED01_12265 [Microbacterium sp. M28]